MIRELKNPLTENYFALKQQVLSKTFPWFYFQYSTENTKIEGFTDVPFYSHTILERPGEGNLHPKVTSSYSDLVDNVLKEILEFNSIEINCFFRINFNCSHYFDGNPTIPHFDHNFSHKNLLIYFNECQGDTFLYDEETYKFSPKEDSIISFEGLHGSGQPLLGQRRIVMVATYF